MGIGIGIGISPSFGGGFSTPGWASGADLWEDFTANSGTLDDPTDTHAQTIYAPNAAGVYTPFSANTLVRTDLGLQTVPTRTNALRNNSMVNATVGSPGSNPTNWSTVTAANGLSRQIVATGTDETTGLPYIDYRYFGTASATAATTLADEANTQLASAVSVPWTHSASIALVGGSVAGLNVLTINTAQRDAGGAYLAELASPVSLAGATATPQRFSLSGTTGHASVAFVAPYFNFTYTIGAVIDFTLRIIAPQMESALFASSPIPTTTTAVTVNGNQQVITGLGTQLATGVAWLNDIDPLGFVNNDSVFSISDGTNNNRIQLQSSSGNLRMLATAGGVEQAAVVLGTTPTTRFVVAGVWAANYVMGRIVGVSAPSPDTSGTYPTVDRVGFGAPTPPGNQFYMRTRKLALDFLAPGDDPATKFAEVYAKAVLAAAA